MFVYILANRDQSKIPKRTKIGISEFPPKRFKELKLHKIEYRGFDDLYIYGVYEYQSGQRHYAVELEHQLNKYYAPYRNKEGKFDGYTEFFNISPVIAERDLIKVGCKKITDPTYYAVTGI